MAREPAARSVQDSYRWIEAVLRNPDSNQNGESILRKRIGNKNGMMFVPACLSLSLFPSRAGSARGDDVF
jgi:hypothetical protein